MASEDWGYEFDMKEIEPGKFQSSYWLISPAGELTERVVLPARTSREESLNEAQETGRAEARRRSQQGGAPKAL